MLLPQFEMAARSPDRDRGFRQLLALHQIAMGGTAAFWLLVPTQQSLVAVIGQASLLAAIVEGALVLGWRLTQLPKTQALEPVLLTPTHPFLVLLGEQLVGLTRLLFLTLSSLPIIAFLVAGRWLDPIEAVLILLLSYLLGVAVGAGLVWAAYEPKIVRTWMGRLLLAGTFFYLGLGILAAEHVWYIVYNYFPFGPTLIDWFWAWHRNNPFALVYRLGTLESDLLPAFLWNIGLAAGFSVLFLARAAQRLKPHYMEENYSAQDAAAERGRPVVGEEPLTWWAVKRVHKYAGTANLYLAIGVSLLYGSYLMFSEIWPFGRQVFVIFDRLGGVGGISTVLTILAAVPAAYQYGLWDSSVAERARRLELLLLTDLNSFDYLRASWSATWSRGRGYFFAACFLWVAKFVQTVKAGPPDIVAALGYLSLSILAGLALLAVYFAIGFACLATNRGGTSIGFALSVVLPLLCWMGGKVGLGAYLMMLPPGLVYSVATASTSLVLGLAMVLLHAGLAYMIVQATTKRFENDLRNWYSHHRASPALA